MTSFRSLLGVCILCLSASAQIKGPELPRGPRKRPGFAPGFAPWQNDLMLAFSKDGLNFQSRPKPFLKRAHVPTVVQDKKGRIIALFQWFPVRPRRYFDRIAVRISEDGAKTWTNPRPIRIKGLPKRHVRPCDPAVVRLADGRLRLYFTCDLLDGKGPRCMSAVSEDAVHYKLEPGVRFHARGGVLDPAVVFFKSLWHYYSPGKDRFGSNYHAVSKDGLKFERKPDVLTRHAKLLGSAVATERGIRFYTGRESFFSTDGNVFVPEKGIRVEGNDPGVCVLSDGRYLMIYGKFVWRTR